MNFSPDCPMPKFDFDVITLGHGSGGILTNKLLESGVFKIFSNEYLDQKHDGAFLDIKGKIAFSTDSFVVSPIFFPGGNIGDLAINGTVNDLAMCGAIPKFISVGFILEEGLKMTEFWDVLISMKAAADKANVQIVTGDTKVVEKGKGDKLFINTTGIGEIHPRSDIKTSNIQIGDRIIINGEIAHHGMTILSKREGLAFESTLQSDTKSLNGLIIPLLNKFGKDIHLMRDPTRGGLSTTLAEFCSSSGFGMNIRESSIPQNEEVSSACELLGLDPMFVANEGLFVCIVHKDIADDVIQTMKNHENGKFASIIGEVVKEHSGQAILENLIGGKRVIRALPGEQLPRIC